MPTFFGYEMMQLTSLLGNSQRLDGGAMFGHVPKTLWSQWITPNDNNQIHLACRCLLIRDGDKTILLETGIGAFFEPKLKKRYGVAEDEHRLLQSLADVGLTDGDIDIVILSHLHFDHAGGLLSAWQADKEPTLLFPNANYVVSQQAWQRACQPHSRDQASFIPCLQPLLEQSKRLVIVESEHSDLLGSKYHFHYSHGHTLGLLLTEITTEQGTLVFTSDLIPGSVWVHLPVTMGYDRFPELLIDEKRELLQHVLQRNGRLFYTHDAQCAVSGITQDDLGRFKAINLYFLDQ